MQSSHRSDPPVRRRSSHGERPENIPRCGATAGKTLQQCKRRANYPVKGGDPSVFLRCLDHKGVINKHAGAVEFIGPGRATNTDSQDCVYDYMPPPRTPRTPRRGSGPFDGPYDEPGRQWPQISKLNSTTKSPHTPNLGRAQKVSPMSAGNQDNTISERDLLDTDRQNVRRFLGEDFEHTQTQQLEQSIAIKQRLHSRNAQGRLPSSRDGIWDSSFAFQLDRATAHDIGFHRVATKLADQDSRLNAHDARLERLEKDMNHAHASHTQHNQRIGAGEADMTAAASSFAQLHERVETLELQAVPTSLRRNVSFNATSGWE